MANKARVTISNLNGDGEINYEEVISSFIAAKIIQIVESAIKAEAKHDQ